MAKARTIVLGGKKKPDFENGPTTPEVEDTVNRVDFMLKLWSKGSAYTVEPEDVEPEWKLELLLELESTHVNNYIANMGNCPEAIQLKLAESLVTQTREILVANPNVSEETLQILANDANDDIATHAKELLS